MVFISQELDWTCFWDKRVEYASVSWQVAILYRKKMLVWLRTILVERLSHLYLFTLNNSRSGFTLFSGNVEKVFLINMFAT